MIFPIFVIPERFERSTHALEGRCSIQLSYGTNLIPLKILLKGAGLPLCGCKDSAFILLHQKKGAFFVKMGEYLSICLLRVPFALLYACEKLLEAGNVNLLAAEHDAALLLQAVEGSRHIEACLA